MESIERIQKELTANRNYYTQNKTAKFLSITHDEDQLVELGCLIVSALEAKRHPVEFELCGSILEQENG